MRERRRADLRRSPVCRSCAGRRRPDSGDAACDLRASSSWRSCSPSTSTRGSACRWAPSGVVWSIDFADLEDLERIYHLMTNPPDSIA